MFICGGMCLKFFFPLVCSAISIPGRLAFWSSSLSLSSSLRPQFLPFSSLVFVSFLYSASFCFFLHRFTLLPLCFSLLFSIQLLYFYLLHFTVSAANCFLNLYHFSSLSFYSLLRFFFPVLERVFLFSYVSV